MGDDPYNFEIALPACHVNKATRNHHVSSSDEDGSDLSASIKIMSDSSSDNDSNRESDHERQERAKPKRTNESKITAPSSGNALDRAKNFLSKYSNAGIGDRNVTKTPISSRSRRVRLDLDGDEDFSVESGYNEEDTTEKNKSATAFSNGVILNKDDNTSSNDSNFAHSDEMDDEKSIDHPPHTTYSETHSPAPLSTIPTRKSKSDESEDGASIESSHSDSSEEQFESFTIPQNTQPKPAYQEDSVDDYIESFQEESMSQSITDNSQHRDFQPNRVTPAFTPEKPQQLIVSDSGIYEEEVFEQEDSALAGTTPTTSIAPIVELSLSALDRSSNFFATENETQAPNHKIIGTPSFTTALEQKVLPLEGRSTDEATSTAKERVTIVRTFQYNEEKRVEMKDASTQFTGNHAAIQADLIPDGMHNVFERAPSQPTSTTSPRFGEKSDACPCANLNSCQREQQPLPTPPISTLFESPLKNLDALKWPVTSSTSIYKQQLLKLQDQILQKKRETEQIVHARMTFEYSSLRGTERVFITARRAKKLELWEALMRVDPTLDERKAREVAHRAQGASM
ncbi:hypothetical protein PHMEG_00026200 [Phytophthora megakarya]|uniref:Uncharacterized protein n=1 Tax=Phytophthora megakarya TaxID=4795 RepID=A0A225VBK3_9STRA|nr:hypothetical protein PHMEG_00026200 [Phytophthora megakarya]